MRKRYEIESKMEDKEKYDKVGGMKKRNEEVRKNKRKEWEKRRITLTAF